MKYYQRLKDLREDRDLEQTEIAQNIEYYPTPNTVDTNAANEKYPFTNL